MALDKNTAAIESVAIVQSQIDKFEAGDPIDTPAQVAAKLAQVYFDYSTTGTLPGADLTVGGSKALLDAAFLSDNTPATIDRLAEGICNYWTTNNTNGTPAHGGSMVISVVIPGATVIPAMKIAVQSLVTNMPVANAWLKFYDETESVVNTIACIITEDISGTPTPFPETIT